MMYLSMYLSIKQDIHDGLERDAKHKASMYYLSLSLYLSLRQDIPDGLDGDAKDKVGSK